MKSFKWYSPIFSIFIIYLAYSKYIENKYILGEPVNFIFITFSVLLFFNIIFFYFKGDFVLLKKEKAVDNIRSGFYTKGSMGFFFLCISLAKVFFDLNSIYYALFFLFLSCLFIISFFYWRQEKNRENVVQKVLKSNYSFIMKNIGAPIGLVLVFMQATSSVFKDNLFYYILPLIFLLWAFVGAIILFRKK